jgi:hypothetical protein
MNSSTLWSSRCWQRPQWFCIFSKGRHRQKLGQGRASVVAADDARGISDLIELVICAVFCQALIAALSEAAGRLAICGSGPNLIGSSAGIFR